MKKPLLFFVGLLVFGVVCARLVQRFREERQDHQAVILAEWSDVRLEAARTGLSDKEILTLLKENGATAILVAESTVQDHVLRGMRFETREDAKVIQDQMLLRGLQDVRLVLGGRSARLVRAASWDSIKDMSLGFDPALLRTAEALGLPVVLRINHDAWLSATSLFQELEAVFSQRSKAGLLFNSDILPTGAASQTLWTTFLQDRQLLHLSPEFKPSKASRMIAVRLPQATFRTHSIAPNEFKDLTPGQEKARWSRALRERACRFLLVRTALDDSLESYTSRLRLVRTIVEENAFTLSWPKVRTTWGKSGFAARRLAPLLALLLAILTPALALRFGLTKKPWASFIGITLITFIGATVLAAVADNPLTRLQVIPFRGVKAAFLLGWVGCFVMLYGQAEVKTFLAQPLKRLDVLCLIAAAAAMGYLLIRTGNAGGGWKVGWEQGFRNSLEALFVARPRFKEFAIGYPLLILGLHMNKSNWSRLLIGLGMIGPITMINTFCHLHSPLSLAYLRSVNGILLGCLGGMMLLQLRKWLQRS